jgi:hypothetical protein
MTQTLILFDDMFPAIYHTDTTKFSILPEWKDRIIKVQEYNVGKV